MWEEKKQPKDDSKKQYLLSTIGCFNTLYPYPNKFSPRGSARSLFVDLYWKSLKYGYPTVFDLFGFTIITVGAAISMAGKFK